jgi:hypothetical protein
MNHVMVLAAAKKDAADQYIQGTTGIALKWVKSLDKL